jgi:hypothetical protein
MKCQMPAAIIHVVLVNVVSKDRLSEVQPFAYARESCLLLMRSRRLQTCHRTAQLRCRIARRARCCSLPMIAIVVTNVLFTNCPPGHSLWSSWPCTSSTFCVKGQGKYVRYSEAHAHCYQAARGIFVNS